MAIEASSQGGNSTSIFIMAFPYPAIYGADYTLESTDFTLTHGQKQSYSTMQCKSITIHVLDDSILEYNESFSLSMVAAHPAIPGATNEITVVIMEDPTDCKFACTCTVIRM